MQQAQVVGGQTAGGQTAGGQTAGGQRAGGSGVVTPEAVRLEFDAAGVGSRAVAFTLDWVIRLVVLFLLGLAGGLAGTGGVELPSWLVVTLASVLGFLLLWGYPIAFETLMHGRTPGKAAMGLRVVTVEGAPIRFRHAAIRAALGLVDFGLTLGFAAVTSALVTERHQRLGDLVAGTLVLRERTGSPAPTAVRFGIPPGAEAYAATIDPAGVTERDYATVRAFLLRARELDPQARAGLAWRIAQPLAERLAHTPPAEVSPELFLACVAARYQQRSQVRAGAPVAVPAPPERGPAPPSAGAAAPHGDAAGADAGPAPAPPADAGPAPAPPGAEGRGEEQPPPSGGGFAPPA